MTVSQSKRVALIDGDIVAYRSSASCEPSKTREHREEEFVAKGRANDICNRIGDKCQADELRVFLSGVGNFRYVLFPNYKANRVGVPKPKHLGAVQQLLVKKWGAKVIDGMEADDAIGIAANADTNFIVCSIDKDLRQIAGEHFNFVKNEFEVVSPEAAAYQLYSQMLIGDTSDNVRGVDGIGPVKAKRVLEGKDTEEMYLTVKELYGDTDRFFLNLRLLSVLRTDDDYQRILGEINENIECESKREEVAADGTGQYTQEFSATGGG